MAARPSGESRKLKSAPHLTLGYAGSLGLGYREGIVAILDALAVTGTRLNLYTRDQHCLVEHPQVINRGFHRPESLWPLVQSECDAMLLPYAFEGPMTRVYRTHFPTKLSEYCWIGMPMLLVGPSDATGVRWGNLHSSAALTCSSPVASDLAPLLERLRDDAEVRVNMGSAAARIALDEFDPVRIRARFTQLLTDAAHVGPAGTREVSP
jgi:hypothetical protein